MSNSINPTELLLKRARLATEVRAFFEQRNVVEVSTPLLSRAAVTDPAIESFPVNTGRGGVRYLRTSPEFPIKRLLSAGAPDLFELGRVFRNGESGRWHNPEFMLLEWYRLGFDLQQLIDEVVELIRTVGGDRLSRLRLRQSRYYDLFEQALMCDVSTLSAAELEHVARQEPGAPEGTMYSDQWLDYLFSSRVQPRLVDEGIVVVTHYPASQAALAKLDPDTPGTAQRFEVFVNGIELANGFEELNNAEDQARRFDDDNTTRSVRGQEVMPIDRDFLSTLNQLPDCSGVALGFDRLLMLTEDFESISQALTIAWSDA